MRRRRKRRREGSSIEAGKNVGFGFLSHREATVGEEDEEGEEEEEEEMEEEEK